MGGQSYAQMHPIYEALSVCSGTIQWLDQQEQRQKEEQSDWDLCVQLARLGKSLQGFVSTAAEDGSVEVPAEVFPFLVFCLGTMAGMASLISRRVRQTLPQRSEGLRQQTEFCLHEIDTLAGKVEDIMEAWEMSLDQRLVTRISAAVKQLDPSKTEIPDWREALELISD
jgi:hypothetical protein